MACEQKTSGAGGKPGERERSVERVLKKIICAEAERSGLIKSDAQSPLTLTPCMMQYTGSLSLS